MIFRLVAKLGREFRVTAVNPRNIAPQQWIVSSVYRERKAQNFSKAHKMPGRRASDSAHNSITGRGSVTFVLIDLRDRDYKLRRSEKEIGYSAAKLAGWAII